METGLATPRAGFLHRTLNFVYKDIQHSIYVQSSLFSHLKQLQEDFFVSLTELREEEITHPMHLMALFLGHICSTPDIDVSNGYDELIRTILKEFERVFLMGNEVHAIVHKLKLDIPVQETIVRNYYYARHSIGILNKPHESALFRAAIETNESDTTSKPVNLFAIFGGQGYEDYFDEFLNTYKIYEPFLLEFVSKQSEYLIQLAEKQKSGYTKGLDIMKWLREPFSRPQADYLLSAPVSLPVIGLLQLCHYVVLCKILGVKPGTLKSRFIGATGHSQGIVSAVAIAKSATWEEFYENSQISIQLLFLIGSQSQLSFPLTTLPPNILSDSLEQGEGHPCPMLSIRGLSYDVVVKEMEAINMHLQDNQKIFISLINGPYSLVLSGPPRSLHGLNIALRRLKASPGENQTRIPFSERKSRFYSRFLNISLPFHSEYLKDAAEMVYKIVVDLGLTFVGDSSLPVYSTFDGRNLYDISGNNTELMRTLIDLICIYPVLWEKATNFEKVTHIVDFGPGGIGGIGFSTHRNKEGLGIRVILAGSYQEGEVGSKYELFDRSEDGIIRATNWVEKFSPKLVKTKEGKIFLDTKMSRLLGLPPIFVAGMTPCTVSWEFVRDTMNAGYQIELAGGGYWAPEQLQKAIEDIEANTTPGFGITINSIYISPKVFAWQKDLVKRLIAAGIPIVGFTIAAGIPSFEVANEIIQNMGVKFVSMKPGSSEALASVIAIAKANPNFPIVCQWTGGRAGGHHSFEDFHAPILLMYSGLRKCDNIILVAGSGFGSAEDTIPYLTGDWATQFNMPKMPFDGCMFGSRMMVAKEAKTSLDAKKTIIEAPGVDDKDWEKTYKGPAGGVITVQSEMGEPIHKLATRGTLFWREMDDKIFKLPKAKRTSALLAMKDRVIKKLNEDFQKVYFPAKLRKRLDDNLFWEWEAVDDLESMTYAEITHRLVELFYVKHQSRFIDRTYQSVLGEWLRRIEERFCDKTEGSSVLQSYNELIIPYPFIDDYLAKFSQCKTQLVNAQDVQYFLSLCKQFTVKPMPFVPILDDDFEFYFKRDSLWQSEDVDAVVGQDVGRIAILQGPVAVRHSTKVNEPIKDILDNICQGHIKHILYNYYRNDESEIPSVEFFARSHSIAQICGSTLQESDTLLSMGVKVNFNDDSNTLSIGSEASGTLLPEKMAWLNQIAGEEISWRRAIFMSEYFIQGTKFQKNPIQRLFKPRYDIKVLVLSIQKSKDTKVMLQEKIKSDYKTVVEVSIKEELIELIIFDHNNQFKKPIGLRLLYEYKPNIGFAPIQEVIKGRNKRIADFYWQLTYGDKPRPILKAEESIEGRKVIINGDELEEFCRVVGNQSDIYVKHGDKPRAVPMDFAIKLGWEATMRSLYVDSIDADLLKLVHLSNSFKMCKNATMLREGDIVRPQAEIDAITNTESGKVVHVTTRIIKEDQPVIEINSKFLFRGVYKDFENTFQKVKESVFTLKLTSRKDVELLRSKKWFNLIDENLDFSSRTLIFKLNSYVRYESQKLIRSVSTKGQVLTELDTKEIVQVASVEYEDYGVYENAVLNYLKSHGSMLKQPVYFENGGYNVIKQPDAESSTIAATPPSNEPYAEISSDFNPIHTSISLASYLEFPGSNGITHGMFTSALARKFVEIFAAENVPERVKSYDVSFTAMVVPNTKLQTKMQHVGMVNGRKLIKIETYIVDSGEKVLEGFSEVEQAISAYVFTGQGSQEQGMGMSLYESSPVAREIWDRADRHLFSNYGFSIIDIVKNNPKELKIYFGGTKGKKIRSNYISMKYEKVISDGTVQAIPIFPEINEESISHTFKSSTGLLSATQFTQPALTLMEKAAFDDMKSKGLIQQNSLFAGHSLGEYSGLAAIGDVMPIESLVDITFYRGLTMQVAVERDEKDRSRYGMIAINPSRISKTCKEDAVQFIVDKISNLTKWLLEIVNYNVEDQQYVAAGDLRALATLTDVLNYIYKEGLDIERLKKEVSMEKVDKYLQEITSSATSRNQEIYNREGFLKLQKGYATIPLNVDVPFHSSFLRSGVRPFRQYLGRRVLRSQVDPQKLIGKYIPNVTAKPFQITKEYFEEVYKITGSSRLGQILQNWSTFEDN